jgi:hypothetical protein
MKDHSTSLQLIANETLEPEWWLVTGVKPHM